MDLYFECYNGISGDMSVAALLDLGASREKLEKALKSLNCNNEFEYKISQVSINALRATDFNVILPKHNHTHEHIHRNLDDVNQIIDKTDTSLKAKNLAKKIFRIVEEAETKFHGKETSEVHFHEVGAIDSIVDILSFAVLFDDLSPNKVYFSTLTEGQGTVNCQHGALSVPVPAVCEIVSAYQIPIKLSDNDGEMITPTGAAIAAAIRDGDIVSVEIIIEKVGNGAGKRKYKNPILRVMKIKGV